jgi:hypothetical protein
MPLRMERAGERNRKAGELGMRMGPFHVLEPLRLSSWRPAGAHCPCAQLLKPVLTPIVRGEAATKPEHGCPAQQLRLSTGVWL